MLRGTQYWNLVSVEVQRQDGTHSRVTGAVFGNQPHIVQVRISGGFRCVLMYLALCTVNWGAGLKTCQ